jgi:hypothetical protein
VPKYELVIEYDGTQEGVIDFARELNQEFGCDLVINRINKSRMIIQHMVEWEHTTDKADKSG